MKLLNYKKNTIKIQLWLNFWLILFWCSIFGFLINFFNFLFIFFFSEMVWLILYCYSIIVGIYTDSLILISFSFFILGFAGLEFAIGFLIIILFKMQNKNLDFSKDQLLDTVITQKKKNKIFLENFFWIK